MNKIKDLAIKYSQWATLLLGVAFLAWMGWTYFFQTSLDIKVDQETADKSVPQLETEMNSVAKPAISVPKYVGEVARGLAGPATRPTPGRWTTAVPLETGANDGGSMPTPGTVVPPEMNKGGTVAKGQVNATPTLTAAEVIGTSYGISSIVPGTFAATGSAPAQVPAGVQPADKAWVTSAYKISAEQLAKDFASVNTPQGLTTEFLRIEVQREEVLPDGSTVNPTIVAPLAGSQLSQHPLPPAYDPNYITWADPNQAEILQSPFYAVVGGSTWVLPGEKRAPSGPFDVTKYLTGQIPDWLTPEEKKLVLDARAAARKKADDEQREKNKNKPHATPPAGGGGPGMGGGGHGGPPGFVPQPPPELSDFAAPAGWAGLAAQDQNLFAAAAAPPSGPPPGGPRGPGAPGGPMMPPPPPRIGPGGEMPPPNPEQQQPAASLVGKVPSTLFDPSAWKDGPITAFAHDDSVEPDKTYHYRMRFFVLNPVYGQPSATTSPALAKVFRWESNWSAWTAPYAVPPRISYFVVAKIGSGAPTVQFEVFHFSKGTLHSKVYAVAPGDLIGSDEDGDLATGCTLVDIRKDAKGGFALVMAPDGTLSRHDIADTATDRYRDLKNQAAAPVVGSTGG